MSEKKVLVDGTEVHFTKDGKPWYWVPRSQVEALKKLEEEWEKRQMEILWGKKK